MTHTHKDRVRARAGTLFRGDDQALITPQHVETMHPLEKYYFKGVLFCCLSVALKKLLLMYNSVEFISS